MDLAFFVVEFGFTPDEYYKLTEKEKMFIKKAHENKFIHDTTWTRNAVMNAEANANRKKARSLSICFLRKLTEQISNITNPQLTQFSKWRRRKASLGWIESLKLIELSLLRKEVTRWPIIH